MQMQKFMFKKVELWLVVIVLLVVLCLAFLFGVVVRGVGLGSDRYGAIGHIAYKVASLPSDIQVELPMLIRDGFTGMAMASRNSDRFPGKHGWTFFDAGRKAGLDGYLLFSRYDGDAGHSVIELVDLKTGKTVHRIDVNANSLFAHARRNSRFANLYTWEPLRFRAKHPLALANGDFLIHGEETPMVRMNACGRPLWVLDNEMFHHSLEQGPDGNYWSPTHVEPPVVHGLNLRIEDPGIVEFNAKGKVLYHRSVIDVMLKQDLGYMMFRPDGLDLDPLHLNDIQPVFEDGPFWKRGDVFLSLRNISTIMLFRPSTGKIVWFKQGPWVHQHDVDVIDKTTIAVFDNNAYSFGHGAFVDGHSDIMFYDFATDTVTTPWSRTLKQHDVRTIVEGLFTLMPGGFLFVEEEESGRTLIFTPDGKLAAENVNRAKSGLIYPTNWSRYMDRAAGDRLLAQLKSAKCE